MSRRLHILLLPLEGELACFTLKGLGDVVALDCGCCEAGAHGRGYVYRGFSPVGGGTTSLGIYHHGALDAPASGGVAQVKFCESGDAPAFATQFTPKLCEVVDRIQHKLQHCAAVHHQTGKQAVAEADLFIFCTDSVQYSVAAFAERLADTLYTRMVVGFIVTFLVKVAVGTCSVVVRGREIHNSVFLVRLLKLTNQSYDFKSSEVLSIDFDSKITISRCHYFALCC